MVGYSLFGKLRSAARCPLIQAPSGFPIPGGVLGEQTNQDFFGRDRLNASGEHALLQPAVTLSKKRYGYASSGMLDHLESVPKRTTCRYRGHIHCSHF